MWCVVPDNFIGGKELARKLAKLGKAAGGKALRNAATVSMTPVVKAAKAAAPKGDVEHTTYKGRIVAPGFLSRNIKKKTFLSKDKTFVSASVGPSREAFYGTQFVEIGRDKTTSQDADPWLEPVFLATKGQVLTKFKEKMKANILKAAR